MPSSRTDAAPIPVLIAATLGALLLSAPARAQAPASPAVPPHIDAVAPWIQLDAATGREALATNLILAAVSDWKRDAGGSLVLHRGSGSPRRVVACALDQPAFVVSQITPDGYLRLHAALTPRRHPLWDQFHEGQRIRVLTRRGPVPGVVGVRSTHLWRARGGDSALASVEGFWVDVGARSAAEVGALGIAALDPVVRDLPSWTFADRVGGPAAAARAGCAALWAAAQESPATGETIFVLAAGSGYGYGGLAAVLAAVGGADSLVLLDPVFARADTAAESAVSRRAGAPPMVLPGGTRVGGAVTLAVRSRFTGSLVESVSEPDLAALFAAVSQAAGVGAAPPSRLLALRARPTPPRDSLAAIAALLGGLADVYAVSAHEAPMREAVRAALPAWARERTTTDSAGNLVLAMGPDRDTAVFIAHLDEIGFEVSGIARDGTLSLRTRGGFFLSLWEGQPALVHVDAASGAALDVPGVFVPRSAATSRQPSELTVWTGLDSAALAARGVAVGASVTGVKRSARLGRSRFTARAVDDRTGCAALILALATLDPARLPHKVIFVWSTREETGLSGAAAAAATFGRTVRRVYAVDTFVSSDSPLESSRFAFAPIGRGAVVRALDNSSVTPPDEVDRVAAVARAVGIPLQVGTTNGGNDGSVFVRYGAIDIPLSWPARYSHSPVETIDLADVRSLARLIAALAAR